MRCEASSARLDVRIYCCCRVGTCILIRLKLAFLHAASSAKTSSRAARTPAQRQACRLNSFRKKGGFLKLCAGA